MTYGVGRTKQVVGDREMGKLKVDLKKGRWKKRGWKRGEILY